jgi:hypothetical protein
MLQYSFLYLIYSRTVTSHGEEYQEQAVQKRSKSGVGSCIVKLIGGGRDELPQP